MDRPDSKPPPRSKSAGARVKPSDIGRQALTRARAVASALPRLEGSIRRPRQQDVALHECSGTLERLARQVV